MITFGPVFTSTGVGSLAVTGELEVFPKASTFAVLI
jgi:hypothetical protein